MENATWLDADEQRVWRGFLRANAALYHDLEKDLRSRCGISLVEYGILVHLSEAEDRRLRMRVLADSVIVSKSRLSHQVARLERDGFVRREHCDDDRRGLWAILTDEGAALLERAAPGHAACVRTLLFDRLDRSQVAQLGEIVTALEGETRVTPGEGSD
ncbi:MarR family transcriptional regulator [Nocardiopsis sp. CNR-923]|uniref:MarR family winged helix-turn-helix transcriptional regulator n=1 Tax=Nocardiopsis sp. CNR-923 TaxID=1904965 RepID=UPI000960FBBC|nr:MarR family transcriptional regulator [Nocardiopsis sp. CNR-923]OLT29093.1 MarR family transcriptional regulator [Nocardiopsis sp. CNR-923]